MSDKASKSGSAKVAGRFWNVARSRLLLGFFLTAVGNLVDDYGRSRELGGTAVALAVFNGRVQQAPPGTL